MAKRLSFIALGCLVLLFMTACSLPQPHPLISRKILFGNPERRDPQISPDGKLLAYLAPDKQNVLQIWLRTMGTQDDMPLTAEKGHGVQHYTWMYDGAHLIFALDRDGDENWNIHSVDIKSGVVRNLTPYKGVQSLLVALDPNFPDEMLIAMNLRNRRLHDVYRLNLKTGDTIMVHRNPGGQVGWVPDTRFNVRVATDLTFVLLKDRDRNRWRRFHRWQRGDPGGFVGFSEDESKFYLLASHDSDTGYLLAVDTQTGEKVTLAQDADYDAMDVFVHPVTRKLQAVSFYKDRLEWGVLDSEVAHDFALLAKELKGEFSVLHRFRSPMLPSRNLGRRDLADKTWIVSSNRDNGSVCHYVYERDSKKVTLLFSEQPMLEGLPLAEMQPISYQSRDGLTIRGYLTLPLGAPAEKLPAVLLVHGGPWSRDQWGYHPIVQWLANRGYAVLQANYRGSTGYGKKHLTASYKEWGGKMHDDLIDGVNWMVDKGIADPKKVAIMGASYGGYATLVGMTLTPDVFSAGVSRVGISNLLTQLHSRPSYWAPFDAMWRRRVGDPAKEEEMLKSRSPLFFVDRIKAPLLIAHGRNDVRVVATESEQMVEAMRKANKPVEYVIYEDEGHRFARPENNIHFYAKAEEFLAKHLGGRFEPAGELSGHAGVMK
jgi:dipeptidyl aminopeptidase/acylaminoacyl peptidase